ncbi:MAG TPA: ADP-ribosylglycohydrolase family protein, partial [Archangium sp.]|nr:ADP-ribosylglycohydrolase family protein [Archangium sp.]
RRIEEVAALSPTLAPWQVAARVGAGEQVLVEDTVPFTLWCAASFIGSFEEAMWSTVSALGDRDTTCAIVGGIVALRSPIPPAWLTAREPLG